MLCCLCFYGPMTMTMLCWTTPHPPTPSSLMPIVRRPCKQSNLYHHVDLLNCFFISSRTVLHREVGVLLDIQFLGPVPINIANILEDHNNKFVASSELEGRVDLHIYHCEPSEPCVEDSEQPPNLTNICNDPSS